MASGMSVLQECEPSNGFVVCEVLDLPDGGGALCCLPESACPSLPMPPHSFVAWGLPARTGSEEDLRDGCGESLCFQRMASVLFSQKPFSLNS